MLILRVFIISHNLHTRKNDKILRESPINIIGGIIMVIPCISRTIILLDRRLRFSIKPTNYGCSQHIHHPLIIKKIQRWREKIIKNFLFDNLKIFPKDQNFEIINIKLEASKPKWVNSVLNIIRVNLLSPGGLQFKFDPIWWIAS